MHNFFKAALELCLMKRNPQDLPYGVYYPPLLVIVLLSIFALIDARIPLEKSPPFIIELVAVSVNLLLVAAFLAIQGFGARIVQTLSAILSIDCFINAIMFVFILIFYPLNLLAVIVFASFFTYCWRLTILVNIFKEAINATSTKAIVITVTYEILRIMILIGLYKQVVA